MVGVLPEYTGLGLSKVLTEKCKELVSGKFEYAVMECTGHFSQRMATKSGFNCIRSYKYSEHLVDGEAIFAKADPPHCKWEFYELKL